MAPIDVLCLLPIIGLGCTYGYFILKPMLRTAGQARFDSRFQLSDFFWLAVLLQMPLVFLAAIHRRLRIQGFGADERVVYVLGALLLILVTYLWWRGASRLTSLGVRDPRRRCVFLIVVLPVAVLGSVVAVPSILIAISAVHDRIHYEWIDHNMLMILLAPLALAGIGFACRKLTVWVIGEPGSGTPTAEDDGQQNPPRPVA